ncbi:Hypothetical protein UVM_LOCUS314 [uncultured virus]|nr:Hypothetical protein UVM_LOCUS314 [uncultured virus]
MSKLLSFDIKTTGADPFKHHMLAIGACLFDSETETVMSKIEYLITPGNDVVFEAKCLREFWLKDGRETLISMLENMYQKGITPERAIGDLVFWIEERTRDCADDTIIISDNVAYDVSWLNHYISKYSHSRPLHYIFGGKYRTIVDTYSYASAVAQKTHSAQFDWDMNESALEIVGEETPEASMRTPCEGAVRIARLHSRIMRGVKKHKTKA